VYFNEQELDIQTDGKDPKNEHKGFSGGKIFKKNGKGARAMPPPLMGEAGAK